MRSNERRVPPQRTVANVHSWPISDARPAPLPFDFRATLAPEWYVVLEVIIPEHVTQTGPQQFDLFSGDCAKSDLPLPDIMVAEDVHRTDLRMFIAGVVGRLP